MTRDDIQSRIALLLSDILDRDKFVLTDATVAPDVPGWDSLAHMRLLVALETELGLTFQVSELTNLKTVGELIDSIQRKLNS